MGEHGPFFVRVMDSDGQMAEMAVVLLVVPAGERESMLPDSVFLRGDPVDRQVIFDGDNVTKVSLAGGDVLELAYPAPVTADGVYLSSIGSGSLSIQAFVGGQWVEAVSTSAGGSFNGHNRTIEFGRFLTSDRWRLVGHSHGGSVREFRPGPAPANPVPVFTSSAYAASLGTSRQVFATVPKVYSDAPATIMFAEGTVVPEGVELVDGVLSVAADADISTTWTFDLVAYDGVGLWASKTFYVTPEAPDASKIMATDFRKTPRSAPEGSGAELDHKMFYDGFVSASYDSVKVDGNEYIEIDFGGPVRYSQLRAEASSGFVLEAYESSGRVTVVDRTVGASASNTISVSGTRVAQKFRLSSKGSSTVIRELRIGGGPSHPYPTIGVSEYISLPEGVNGSNRNLNVSRGTNYTTAPLQYEVVYGELPPGAYFTAERVFLSSLAQVGNGPWWVKVRVSDDLGFSTEKRLTIAGGVPEASSYMATDFYLEGAPEQPIDHRQFYDGESSNDAFVKLEQPLVVDST